MIFVPRFIGPVFVDAVIKETIESTLKITERPVEFGADITDHAYVKPQHLIIEGAIGGGLTTSSFTRAAALAGWQALKFLQKSREPFAMVSGLDIHTNMLIEKLVPERTKDWSVVLKFTAELKEIQIVGGAFVSGSPGSAPAGGQASGLTGQNLTSGSSEALRAGGTAARGDAALSAVSTTSGASGSINQSALHSILN